MAADHADIHPMGSGKQPRPISSIETRPVIQQIVFYIKELAKVPKKSRIGVKQHFWTASGQRRIREMQSVRQLLVDVYKDVYGPKITIANLNELAADLSGIAGRPRPWTGKFLHSIIKEYAGFAANGHLNKALTIMAARLDGADDLETRAQEVDGLLAVNDLPPGTLVLGQARRCATPGCPVRFVPTHPRQKYHSKTCAELARRQRDQVEVVNRKSHQDVKN